MKYEYHVVLLILGFVIGICLATESVGDGKLKLVIDNDAGGDDAMAIFIALLNEKHFDGPKLVALTTGNGNTNEDYVSKNNQWILKVAGRQDVPIYRGSKTSLGVTPETIAYYGIDGLGDSGDNVTGLVPVEEGNAILELIQLSKKYEGELVVVTIGTLTNVALAVKLDPDFISRLSQLYVAAGHIYSDVHAFPEFNAEMDVDAYHVIAQNANPDKVTIVPFSQTKTYLNLTKTWRKEVLGGIDNALMKEQNKFEYVSIRRPGDQWTALDPAAVSAAVRPALVKEYRYSKNDIIRCGEYKGINTNQFVTKEKANVRVIYSYKDEDYKQYLLDLFSRGA